MPKSAIGAGKYHKEKWAARSDSPCNAQLVWNLCRTRSSEITATVTTAPMQISASGVSTMSVITARMIHITVLKMEFFIIRIV